MNYNFDQLRKDLEEAREKAIKASTGEDGGSANLDKLALALPCVKKQSVVETIRKAGLYTIGKVEWIGKRYFISAPIPKQGNDNTRQIEVMYQSLKEKGYDVLIYWKMD